MPNLSLAQDNPVPPQPEPGGRPNDCGDQCAVFSTDGTEVHLYYKAGRDPSDDIYDYVAISEKLTDWQKSIYGNAYVFRARKTAKRTTPFYILLQERGPGLNNWIVHDVAVRAHYKVGGNIDWDQEPVEDQNYNIIGKAYAPSGVTDGNRYSWRIVISGKVSYKLNESAAPAPAAGAWMQIRLDEEKGPFIGLIKTDDKGNFKYSGVDTYVSDDKVNNLYIYTKYAGNGVKFESDPQKNPETMLTYLDGSWHTNAEDNKSKVRGDVNITLNKTVTEFWDPTNAPGQTLSQEVFGNNKGWVENAINFIKCVLRNTFIAVLQWEANAMGWFLRRNY